ncbi:MAG: hypothetical protein JSS47_09145 [Proteobacteria bacterium]|nr:hypothetical protein [Pseudomonadota bacterium]
MFDLFLSYFIERPRRLVDLGRQLFTGSSFLILLGLIGYAATSSVATVSSMAGQPPVEVTLATMLPGVPTWWVPEGPAGFILAGVCLVAGLAVIRAGRAYERLLRY